MNLTLCLIPGKFFLVALFLIIPLSLIYSKDYYVDVNGSDQAEGTAEAPFKSINHALSMMAPGDRCYVSDGTYYETLHFPRAGTCDKPIEVIASGDSVFITGTRPLNDWIDAGDGMFKTYAPDSITQFFVDRVPQIKAKYPNQPVDTNLFEFTTFDLEWDEQGQVISSAELHHQEDYWKGATIWAMVGHRWVSQTAKIVESSGETLSFDYNSYPGEHGTEGTGFLTNTMAALDTVGEWHWEADTLYYIPESGTAPDDLLTEGKTSKWTIDLSGQEYIKINGIRTFAGAVNMDEANYCVLKDMEIKYLSEFDYIDKEKTSWASSWSRHEWTNIDTPYGIGVGVFGNHNRIEDCHIAWSAGDGITLFGDSNLVLNSIVRDCAYRGTDCSPVALAGTGNKILQNTMYNGGRNVIQSVIVGKEFTIRYNRLYQSGLVNWDVGVIYCFNIQSEGAEIAYNWVSQGHSGNPESGWGGHGVYIDNNCSDFLIHHNVVWDTKGDGIRINKPALNHQVYNNTIFETGPMTTYQHPDYNDPSLGCEFVNNYITADILSVGWLETSHNISSEEDLLVNRSGKDFRPAFESGLIDSGKIIPGITDNYSGDAPDIGAYESNASWVPGRKSDNTDCECEDCRNDADVGNCQCSNDKATGLTGSLEEESSFVHIFPNPATDYVSVHLAENKQTGEWKIVGADGRLHASGQFSDKKQLQISLTGMQKALYLLVVDTNTGGFRRCISVR